MNTKEEKEATNKDYLQLTFWQTLLILGTIIALIIIFALKIDKIRFSQNEILPQTEQTEN